MKTKNFATVTISKRLWNSVSISLDQQEAKGTEDISEEIIHTDREGIKTAIICADSHGAQCALKRALKKNPDSSTFVFVRQ